MRNIENKLPLYVAYASDENYAPIAAVSILSLMEHNQDAPEIIVYYLADNMSEQAKKNLKEIVEQYQRKILFFDMKDIVTRLKKLGANAFGKNSNYSTYGPIFIQNFVEDTMEKILFLDCDTLICESLQPLFEEDLGQYALAAVKDILPEYYCKKLGIARDAFYFNSGVLLFNLPQWRKLACEEKAVKIMLKKHPYYWMPDQDILNVAFQKEIKVLDARYNCLSANIIWNYKALKKVYEVRENYYTKKEIDNARKNPVIIHMVPDLFNRPWQDGKGNFMAEKWRAYLDRTKFAENFVYMKKEETWKRKLLKKLFFIVPNALIAAIYGKRVREKNKIRLLGEK